MTTQATWPPPDGWRADEVMTHDALEHLKALAASRPNGFPARSLYAEMKRHGWGRGHGQRDIRVLVRAGIIERIGDGIEMRYQIGGWLR